MDKRKTGKGRAQSDPPLPRIAAPVFLPAALLHNVEASLYLGTEATMADRRVIAAPGPSLLGNRI